MCWWGQGQGVIDIDDRKPSRYHDKTFASEYIFLSETQDHQSKYQVQKYVKFKHIYI